MHCIEVLRQPALALDADRRLAAKIRQSLGLTVTVDRTSRVYYVRAVAHDSAPAGQLAELLADPVAETVFVDEPLNVPCDWILEVAYKPGVTDNAAHIAADTLTMAQSCDTVAPEHRYEVRTATRYYLTGDVEEADVRRIADTLLANALVQAVSVVSGDARPTVAEESFEPVLPTMNEPCVEVVLPEGDAALAKLSREGLLALTVAEMRVIRDFFADPDRQTARRQQGLPLWPTNVELEAIAQTWSEHCKHKIFNDRIRYVEDGTETIIDGLFPTYIKGSTKAVAKERDWLVSVFEDNAGVIRWTDDYHAVFKAETHNAPSALEPYGGALTGIVGVNRDPAGTGLGAKLVFNTDVFCFAPLSWSSTLPPGVLHPQRLFDGVRQGVEDGGNQSGIPTINGALFFDERYLGRPLVFCGTGAIMPVTTAGRPTHEKAVEAFDLIVMAGGRVGKDGVHGATFSSEAINSAPPVGVVQIGDPITQKRTLDLLAEARDLGLYRAITDNGAGGLSSSVGEMAQLSGGAVLALDQVLLKYAGLAPWEILVSESQERMTLAVAPSDWPALAELADRREVELSVIGTFTADGAFVATWHGQPVMNLPMAFLHGGLPKRLLEATWTAPDTSAPPPSGPCDANDTLLTLLGSLNVCSRESVIRQYDHEVQGGSVVKPLVGIANDGPSDAAVIRPVLESDVGLVVSCAINPHYGDHDTEAMARLMVDEAIRNAVAVGGDPDHLALLDNFCWPDPIVEPQKNPDGAYKLAQLVRACRGLFDATIAYGTPLISGKDSMKNDYHGPDGTISVPPTLLVSAIGRHPDIRRAVTMDVKAPGDLVYLLGVTRNELGGSQYARLHHWTGGMVPSVDLTGNRNRYHALHRAILAETLASCHDCSEGGLAVALAEMAFAGGFGVFVDLAQVPTDGPVSQEGLLFGESSGRHLVTVAPEDQSAFERHLHGHPYALIGVVTNESRLQVHGTDGQLVIDQRLAEMKAAWQGGLA